MPALPVAAAAAAISLVTGYVVPLLVSPLLAVLLHRWRRVSKRRRDAAAQRAEVLRFCVALSAELRAGRPPREAAARAAGDVADARIAAGGVASIAGATTGGGASIAGATTGGVASIARAAASGAELTGALRAAAAVPGAEALRRVAACWQVAEHRGAGLAAAIDRLTEGLHVEQSHRQEVDAQLSGARATARLLAVLPAFGLLLGMALGADPLAVLFGTPYGPACLVLGGALDAAGLLWMQRLVSTAEGGT